MTCFIHYRKKARRRAEAKLRTKRAITDEAFKKLSDYFTHNMSSNASPHNLQEIVLFNIIYYLGCRGHAKLRSMTRSTFKIGKDTDGRHYILQALKECDKNHSELDIQPSNEARIYKVRGKQRRSSRLELKKM